MAQVRKTQFWFDVNSTLTEFSGSLNSQTLRRTREILDNTGLNEDDESGMPGMRRTELPISGYYNTNDTGLAHTLWDAQDVYATTSTFQIKVGADYYYGEAIVQDVELGSADGRQLVPFSATLFIDGGANRTSVNQAT